MTTSKLILCSCLFLTGCATTGATQEDKSFEQKYSETTKVVQTCMYNAILGVLSLPVKGFEEFHDMCSERN